MNVLHKTFLKPLKGSFFCCWRQVIPVSQNTVKRSKKSPVGNRFCGPNDFLRAGVIAMIVFSSYNDVISTVVID